MDSFLWPPLRQTAIAMLKAYEIPRHVSLIVDGNRTYGRKVGISMTDAYDKGVDAIFEQIHLCSELGVQILSIYLFSDSNFKRSREEIDILFRKFAKSFIDVAEGKSYGGCYKLIGDLSKFPEYFRSAATKMETATRDNTRLTVYLVYGYIGKNELTEIAMQIQKSISHPAEVSLKLTDDFTYIPQSACVPTLLIRTGQKRLSGFLPWQIFCGANKFIISIHFCMVNCKARTRWDFHMNAFSTMYFLDKLWPEFTDMDMFKAIFHFQHHNNECIKFADSTEFTKQISAH